MEAVARGAWSDETSYVAPALTKRRKKVTGKPAKPKSKPKGKKPSRGK